MTKGLNFALLWCAASVLGTLAISFFEEQLPGLAATSLNTILRATVVFAIVFAVLIPTLHWMVLRRAWGRPYLFLWLLYAIIVPLILGWPLAFLLITPLLSELHVAVQDGNAEQIEAAQASIEVWWRQAVLAIATVSGYALALRYISGKVAWTFFLASALAIVVAKIAIGFAPTPEQIYGSTSWLSLAEIGFIDLIGGIAIWIASHPVRTGLEQNT